MIPWDKTLTPLQILQVALINVGVPAKGMIPWDKTLTPLQILQVASYILTLEGTNPPIQKAPEGEIYIRS